MNPLSWGLTLSSNQLDIAFFTMQAQWKIRFLLFFFSFEIPVFMLLVTGFHGTIQRNPVLPENYVLPETQRSRLSEVAECNDVPVGDRDLVVKHSRIEACGENGFFQLTPPASFQSLSYTLFFTISYCPINCTFWLQIVSMQLFVQFVGL